MLVSSLNIETNIITLLKLLVKKEKLKNLAIGLRYFFLGTVDRSAISNRFVNVIFFQLALICVV